MTDRDDRRLFADGPLYDVGEWVATEEWFAHKSLDLPADWLDWTIAGEQLKPSVARYLAAVEREYEPVFFGEPYEVVCNGTWTYQDAVGQEPFGINADVREFFEGLVPDGEWFTATTRLIRPDHGRCDGPIYALAQRSRGVVVVVAAYDPRLTKVAT